MVAHDSLPANSILPHPRFLQNGLPLPTQLTRLFLRLHCPTIAALDESTGHLYGVEKIWAYLHYRKDPVELKMAPALKEFLSTVEQVRQFADPSFAPTPVEGADDLEAPPSSIPLTRTKGKGARQRKDSGASGSSASGGGGGRPRSGSGARPRSGSNSRARGGSGTFQRPRSGSNARDGSSLKKGSSPTKEA